MHRVVTVLRGISKPRLKPGGNRTFSTRNNGEILSEKWWKVVIYSTRFLTFKPGFKRGWERVALLRCLFWERSGGVFPTSGLCSGWRERTTLRIRINSDITDEKRRPWATSGTLLTLTLNQQRKEPSSPHDPNMIGWPEEKW